MNINSDRFSSSSNKILVVQPLPGIGDTFWHLKAFRGIAKRSTSKKITLLTRQRTFCDQYLHEQNWIDEILWIDENKHRSPLGCFALAKYLKEYHFDEIWILHHSPKYYLAAYLAGIPKRFGYGFGWEKIFINAPPSLPHASHQLHNIKRCYQFLELHGIIAENYPTFDCNTRLQEKLNTQFSQYPKPWISLGFGSSDATRTWPANKFAELIEQLSQLGGNTIFLCGSKDEKQIAHNIQSIVRGKNRDNVNIQTDLSIYEMIHFLSLCDLFVGNDSGLLNVAANVGTQSVGIFRNLGAEIYSANAFQTMHTNIKNNLLKPVSEIPVHDVLDKVLNLLQNEDIKLHPSINHPTDHVC